MAQMQEDVVDVVRLTETRRERRERHRLRPHHLQRETRGGKLMTTLAGENDAHNGPAMRGEGGGKATDGAALART